MPSLKVIPDGIWQGMGTGELLIAVCLVVPGFYNPLAVLVPIAAALIAIEVVLFCALHLRSGADSRGALVYRVMSHGAFSSFFRDASRGDSGG